VLSHIGNYISIECYTLSSVVSVGEKRYTFWEILSPSERLRRSEVLTQVQTLPHRSSHSYRGWYGSYGRYGYFTRCVTILLSTNVDMVKIILRTLVKPRFWGLWTQRSDILRIFHNYFNYLRYILNMNTCCHCPKQATRTYLNWPLLLWVLGQTYDWILPSLRKHDQRWCS